MHRQLAGLRVDGTFNRHAEPEVALQAGVVRSLLCMAQELQTAYPAPGLQEQDSLKSAQIWYAALTPDCGGNHAGQKRPRTSEQLCEPGESPRVVRRGTSRADGAGTADECMSPNSAECASAFQWHYQVWPQPHLKLQTDALEDDATSPCLASNA